MLNKMPGYYDDKFKGLMALYAYMYAHPGKKLNFMGNEIGTFDEWNYDAELPWSVLEYDRHRWLQDFVRKLNEVYKSEPSLYEVDDSYDGYEWIDFHDNDSNVIAFERIDSEGEKVLCFFNFSPVYRENYKFGVDKKGMYKVLLNSAHKNFGGPVNRNQPLYSKEEPAHYRRYSVSVNLQPYQALFIKYKK